MGLPCGSLSIKITKTLEFHIGSHHYAMLDAALLNCSSALSNLLHTGWVGAAILI